jgi:phosphodiesterase/alkaline phosphatase D-like protein
MTRTKTQPSSAARRQFLRYTWQGVGASFSLAPVPGRELFGAARFGDNPFTLGVASGDPTAEGIVLWTRLAPLPADPAGLGRRVIPVGWRVAGDSRMRHVVARGVATAPAELAHSVHVEVEGLRSGRDYFYQFDVRGEESAVKYYEGDRRGYFKATVTPRQMRLDLRFVTTVESPAATGYTAGSWVVHDGVPGAVPA